MNRYVGFYWTRPVLWAGFRALPAEVEAAARHSKTIRYQVERVRHWVNDQGAKLVGETLFLDISPDRTTELFADTLRKTVAICKQEDAGLVYVEFSASHGWRRSQHLIDQVREVRTRKGEYAAIGLPPEPMVIEGRRFDPIRHFKQWEDREAEAREKFRTKDFAELLEVARTIPEGYGYFPKIAHELNARDVKTPTGKAWTAESVRKALKRYADRTDEP